MPKNQSVPSVNQVVGDILASTDDYRDPAAVDAAGRRLAAYSPAQIQAAKDQLRYDRVGFDADKIDALRHR